ncbi:MAG: ABC transporter permease, partial [Methanobacteriota archaeon]
IQELINDVSRISGDNVIGTNEIETLTAPFQLTMFFLMFFDIVVLLPLVVLAIYLLIFGLTLSLEERRQEIAIFKVQGAYSDQILSGIRREGLLVFLIASMIGFLGANLSVWLIIASSGFLSFNWHLIAPFIDANVQFVLIASIIPFFTMLLAIQKKAKQFIKEEIYSGIQLYSEEKLGFIARNNIDLILLIYGGFAAFVVILQSIKFIPPLENFFVNDLLLRMFALPALWIGGITASGRLVQTLSERFENQFVNLPKLKNVGLIIKSGLKRRGDAKHLIIILVLAISIVSIASIQGRTDLAQKEAMVKFNVGADIKIVFSEEGNYSDQLRPISHIKQFTPIIKKPLRVLSYRGSLFAMNSSFLQFLNWDPRAIDPSLFVQMEKNDNFVLLGRTAAEILDVGKGDVISVKFQSENNHSTIIRYNVTIAGIFEFAPGGIPSTAGITSLKTIQSITSLISPKSGLNASDYLVKLDDSNNEALVMKELEKLPDVAEVIGLQTELKTAKSEDQFGISGILNLMYLTSLIMAFIGAFTFSAVLVEKRKQDFAIFQTLGATPRQLYLVIFGENFLIVFIATLLANLIGIGLSFLINGFFGFIKQLLLGITIPRYVVIDPLLIFFNSAIIIIGVVFSVLLSARHAINQDLTISTKE